MSHLVETMFAVGQVPWHKQGTVLPSGTILGSEDAIQHAQLDWDVVVQPLYTPAFVPASMELPGGETIHGGGFQDDPLVVSDLEQVKLGGLVRRVTDGQMMGVVGPRWTPVQNREAFRFFDPLVKKGLARYHTAGSLKNGRVIWILAQVGNEALITGDDTVANFLLLSMGHDGSRGVQVMPTPIRVVCANTLGFAESNKRNMMKIIHHTGNAVERLEELSEFIEPYTVKFDELVSVFKGLAAAQLNEEMVEKVLRTVFPDPLDKEGNKRNTTRVESIRNEVRGRFEGEMIGMELVPSGKNRTAWTLYNSVTEYVDHERGRTADTRLEAAWFGGGRDIKNRALAAIKVAVA